MSCLRAWDQWLESEPADRSLAALLFIPGVVAFGQAASSTVRQIGERERTKINFHCRERNN
jgi:hypothetical protein